jgi:hypothetical protein
MINGNQIQAIYKLYPQVVTIRGDVAFDAENNQIAIDQSLVDAEIAKTAYIVKRQAEYPPIGDQLDALWKGGEAAADMLVKVQAVKAKYPKVGE